MNLRMLWSRAIGTSHVLWRFIVNILRIPVYLSQDRGFLYQQWRGFVADVINLEKEYQTQVRRLDWTSLQSLVGGYEPAVRIRFGSRYGNISFPESVALAYLVKSLRPCRIFEIGTFDGFSTYHLAMNADLQAEVFTLNLPVGSSGSPEDLPSQAAGEYFGDNTTHQELQRRGVGAVYRACSRAGDVRQLFGDSLSFDFSPYRGKIDLCFIDGGHSLECVSKDTDSALAMLSDRGVIVWHDFNVQHPDIYRFLMEFSRSRQVYWIQDTRLALCGPGLGRSAT